MCLTEMRYIRILSTCSMETFAKYWRKVNKVNFILHSVFYMFPSTTFSDIQLESHMSGSQPIVEHMPCNFSHVLWAVVKNRFWSSILQFQPHLLISYMFYANTLPALSALLCSILYKFLHSNPVDLQTFLLREAW